MLAPATAWAAARKSRIFGGFLRFLTRYDGAPCRFITGSAGLDGVQIPRSTANRPLLAHISAYGGVWRFWVGQYHQHGQRRFLRPIWAGDARARYRSAAGAICPPVAGSTITASGSRFGMFRAWGAGQGAACLTLLMPQRRPVSGHKKTPAGYYQRGRLLACAGLKGLAIQLHRPALRALGFR